MLDYTGWIVRSEAGHDKGNLFCVIGVQPEGSLLLCDGKRRRMGRPKRKKPGHVTPLADHRDPFQHPVIQMLKDGQAPTDRELRRMLAAFQAESRRD